MNRHEHAHAHTNTHTQVSVILHHHCGWSQHVAWVGFSEEMTGLSVF